MSLGFAYYDFEEASIYIGNFVTHCHKLLN